MSSWHQAPASITRSGFGDPSQKMTVAANARAEKKIVEHDYQRADCAGGFAAAANSAVQESIRSRGTLDIVFREGSGRHCLARSFQSGCLRLRVPRPGNPAEKPSVVIINTAGGITGGDRLQQSLRWGRGASATVTTQAAEKVYRALSHAGAPTATIETTLQVEQGARAEWLPQETILFDGSRLRREARVLLDEDVAFLGVEALVLGRAAMGETLRSASLSDRLRIWRGGRLVYADAFVLDGEIDRLMHRAAIGGGARASAVIVKAVPGVSAQLGPVRQALACARGRAAASAWHGLLAIRLLAADGESLRHDIAAALAVLREGRPLPRVWRC